MPVDNSIDFCGPAWGVSGPGLGISGPGLWITQVYLWITIVHAVDNSGDLWVNRGQAVDSLWIRWACGVSVLVALMLPCGIP